MADPVNLIDEDKLPGSLVLNDLPISPLAAVPQSLQRATARLSFPPSYIVVGVYRLATDRTLYVPVWDKCRHGAKRGAGIAFIWAALTFKIQRKFVEWFFMKSPRVTGLSSTDTIFGIPVAFDLRTYATLVFLSTQVTMILTFFLSRNLRIARDRAWEQTIISRGKGPDFWKPYVEEWDSPPPLSRWKGMAHWASTTVGRVLIKLMLMPLHLIPVAGIAISAGLRALGTARSLHKSYFESKKMTKEQISVFIEERKWEYRSFGFAAAILEGLPIVGLVFSISNRIGAAMWAHDLEKRQHYVAELKARKTS